MLLVSSFTCYFSLIERLFMSQEGALVLQIQEYVIRVVNLHSELSDLI